MGSLIIALGSLILYLIAYHTYARWLARRVFKLDSKTLYLVITSLLLQGQGLL